MPNDFGQRPGVENDKVDILVVDDLPEKLLVMQTVLEELGQNLVLARSGGEALREILKRDFAVILLDVQMPDIDGMETASLIRRYRRSAHTPIIFITAYADELQTRRGYELGAVDYIFSPVVPEVLRSKVKVFVELYQMQRRIRDQAEERIALVQAEAARIAAEEGTRRLRFLARAGHELSGLLHRSDCAHRLLELVVPELAAVAVLGLHDAEGGGEVLTSAVCDEHGVRFAAQGTMPAALSRLLAAAAAGEHLPPLSLQVHDLPQDWPRGLRTAAAFALRAGGRTVGALAVASESLQALDAGNLSVLEQLAERAATALENARLYSNLQQEIVDRQEAEVQLEEANRRKDEFLAMLSHELRNPLAPIRSAVEVMRRAEPAEPALAWTRDVIERQLNHLTRLVDELLDMARIAQGKISLQRVPILLSEVAAHAVEATRPLMEQHRHELLVSLPREPLFILGDLTRLAQAVANLLNNAAKYTPDGGRIELIAGVEDEKVFLSVRDNGVGIEPELLGRVFDLFEQGSRSLDRSQGGLGIGLTLVRHLVELHGGQVEGRSRGQGMGTEFRVLLPLLREPRAELPLPQEVPAPPAQRRRVLVVDDNSDAAETMAAVLELEGHQVEVALDGLAALDRARQFLPEVILLDIGLPNISGYEVAQQLRQDPRTREAMLIALTGYGRPEDISRTVEAGFDKHFVKPIEVQRILEAIDKFYQEPLPRLSAA